MLELSVIGRVTAQAGLTLRAPDGSPFRAERAGFDHFGGYPGAGGPSAP